MGYYEKAKKKAGIPLKETPVQKNARNAREALGAKPKKPINKFYGKPSK